MTRAGKIALLPLIVLWLWALPRDAPDVEVAGALQVPVDEVADGEPTSEALADAVDETPASTSVSTTSETSTTSQTATRVETSTTVSSTTATTTTVVEGVQPAASVAETSTTAARAPTTTVAPPSTNNSPPPIGVEALALVSFDWQSRFPGWQVKFRGERSGIRALTYPHDRLVEIFVRDSDTPQTLHRVFAHELGHVVDVVLNNDADRQRWAEQRNLPEGTPWWPSAEAPDFHTGAGDFAEAFAVMESGVVSRSTVGSQPTAQDLELLRDLMRG